MKKDINDILITKKQKYLVVTTILLLLVSIGLFSYALTYDINYMGLNTNKISNCNIDVSFKDSNPIRLLSSYPMDYVTAKEYDPYTFYIKSNNNNCNNLSYRITMVSICNTCTTDACDLGNGITCNCTSDYQMDTSLINYELKNVDTEEIKTGTLASLNEEYVLSGSEKDRYEMRIWISDTASNDDLYVGSDNTLLKNYCGKLNVTMIASNEGSTN